MNLLERAQRFVAKREKEQLLERWFAKPEGLLDFAFEAVTTKDERDGLVKSIPREAYLVDHLTNYLHHPIYFVLKSRQILITWTTFIALTWSCIRERFFTVALIPKKEEDGVSHITDRIQYTIWESLPPWLRDMYDPGEIKGHFHLRAKEGVGRWDSWIISVARGRDQVRQLTLARLFFDEMAFQPLARGVWRAAMPTISSRGMDKEGQRSGAICVSTLNPGSFHDELMGGQTKVPGEDVLMVDRAVAIANGEELPSFGFTSPGPGICHYFMKGRRAFCAVYSFTADSQKRDPAWEQEEAARLYGGVDTVEWQVDFRMRRAALAGTLIYPDFNVLWNLVDERALEPGCELFLSMDFGHTNPAAILFWEWNQNTRTLTGFDEIYMSETPVPTFKQLILSRLGVHLGLHPEEIVFSDVLGHNVGDPEGAGTMLEFAQEPNPLIVIGNPGKTTDGMHAWRINTPVSAGERRLNSGFRPSVICCGIRQYADHGTTDVVCVARGVSGERCGKHHAAAPQIVIMRNRMPHLVEEIPLQKRPQQDDPNVVEPTEKRRKIADHAESSARYAVMRTSDFLADNPGEPTIAKYLTEPISKLGAVDSFWRTYHDEIEKLKRPEDVAEAGEIVYPEDEWEPEIDPVRIW